MTSNVSAHFADTFLIILSLNQAQGLLRHRPQSMGRYNRGQMISEAIAVVSRICAQSWGLK
jgi:hypothetical protein